MLSTVQWYDIFTIPSMLRDIWLHAAFFYIDSSETVVSSASLAKSSLSFAVFWAAI